MSKKLFQKGNKFGKGRPKGSLSLVTILKKKLEEMPEGTRKTYAQLLIDKQLSMALKDGNEAVIRLIMNYIDGMPKQPVEHSGEVNIKELILDE